MVGRKRKTKICGRGSEEVWISKLPDALIYVILTHVPTKDAVRTSDLSTRWRSLWQCVPGLDLDSHAFSNSDAFVSFAESFFYSHMESWLHKLRLRIHYDDYDANKPYLSSWIDALTTRRIHHLDFDAYYRHNVIPGAYIPARRVHLRLCNWVALLNAEFVSIPCLKIIHLDNISNLNEAFVEKLISCSPVLEDLTISDCTHYGEKVIQVRSQTLKRIYISEFTIIVIDAPKDHIYSITNASHSSFRRL